MMVAVGEQLDLHCERVAPTCRAGLVLPYLVITRSSHATIGIIFVPEL
jgi:hypothetical protein